jgi:uncharacterized protein
MIIDLNELRKKNAPLRLRTEFSEQQLQIRSSLASLDDRAISQMQVSLSGERVSVNGTLKADLSVICCRCARGFPQNVDKAFSVEYWPDPKVDREGEERELTYDDLSIGFYREDQIDLTALVTEQILLEIPMKPLCDEACLGLCDQCGKDLNEGSCKCGKSRLDPRLQVLEQLKNKMIN